MMMGDEAALTLGIPLRFYWYLYVTMVAVLTAVLVATCGIIGFVGLITPSLSSRVSRNELQETFSCCDHTGCPLCRLGRCTLSCHYSKC